MVDGSSHDVTRLLIEWSHGNRASLERLMPLVYDELRHLARRNIRHERAGHTLQPTALVHEAYLKLVDQRQVKWHDRAHFYAVAAQVMRRILVDHARRHAAAKRGGAIAKLSLDDIISTAPAPNVDFVLLDDLLERLATFDERQSRVVELRFFGGLTVEETAEALNVSPATVKSDWRVARAWLYSELQGGEVS